MEAPLESLALRWSDSNFESGQVWNWKLINSIQETLQNPASNNVKVLSNVYANSLNMNVMTKFFVTILYTSFFMELLNKIYRKIFDPFHLKSFIYNLWV